MKRKHALTTAVVLAILVALIYSQFRHWRSFDWQQFWSVTREVNLWRVLAGVGLIYLTHLLRAVRWKIFLRPTCHTTVARLLPAQFIGFTGLALLGRPGELVRPFLIARKESLTFSSQLAVWAVERVFDMSAVAVLMGITLAVWGEKYRAYPFVQMAGYALLGIAAGMAIIVFFLWWRSEQIASLFESMLKPRFPRAGDAVCRRLLAFGQGLHTIQDLKSFVLIVLLSLGVWVLIARSYIEVMHAYPVSTVAVQADSGRNGANTSAPLEIRTVRLHHIKIEDAMLVMGASITGSMVQLPGVGGGSQLAVIDMLSRLYGQEPYNVTRELAVSCGMLLWLVTFMAVIPTGLILAHRERVSLRVLTRESEMAATRAGNA